MTEHVRQEEAQAPPPPGSRPWRGITAAAAVAVFGIALTAAFHPPSGDQSRYLAVESDARPLAASALDPLMAELVRCRALLPQVDDARCRAAWEENRRRFFGESRAMRVPGDPLPTNTRILDAAPALAPAPPASAPVVR